MSDKLKYQLFYLACLWGGTALLWVMQGFWTALAVFVMVGAAVIGNQDREEGKDAEVAKEVAEETEKWLKR